VSSSITISVEPWDCPDAVRLRAADAFSTDTLSRDILSTDGLVDVFLIARDETGTAVGCAGLRPLGPDSAEIKPMIVDPQVQDSDVPVSILRRLESEARRAGVATLILETVTAQPDAVRVYEREGYERIENFGPYQRTDLSVCYSRTLPRSHVRITRLDPSDPSALEASSRLLTTYLIETEAEKHQYALAAEEPLPQSYQREAHDPQQAFASGAMFLAWYDDEAVGVVGLTAAKAGKSAEIKRLWVSPSARGLGTGEALLRAAMHAASEAGHRSARLTVWRWRTAALTLYERLGFKTVDSWDARPELVCMERDLTTWS
jgi:putative acetyltransferase